MIKLNIVPHKIQVKFVAKLGLSLLEAKEDQIPWKEITIKKLPDMQMQ
jgi:hypothetical protein